MKIMKKRHSESSKNSNVIRKLLVRHKNINENRQHQQFSRRQLSLSTNCSMIVVREMLWFRKKLRTEKNFIREQAENWCFFSLSNSSCIYKIFIIQLYLLLLSSFYIKIRFFVLIIRATRLIKYRIKLQC